MRKVSSCISCQWATGPVEWGARINSAMPMRLSVLEPSSMTRRVKLWPMRMVSPACGGTRVMGFWGGGGREGVVVDIVCEVVLRGGGWEGLFSLV